MPIALVVETPNTLGVGLQSKQYCEATKGDDCRMTWVGATPANIMDKMAIALLGGN